MIRGRLCLSSPRPPFFSPKSPMKHVTGDPRFSVVCVSLILGRTQDFRRLLLILETPTVHEPSKLSVRYSSSGSQGRGTKSASYHKHLLYARSSLIMMIDNDLLISSLSLACVCVNSSATVLCSRCLSISYLLFVA